VVTIPPLNLLGEDTRFTRIVLKVLYTCSWPLFVVKLL
jgi:hypothetical protein